MRITRPLPRTWGDYHETLHLTPGVPHRPAGRAAVMAPLPVAQPGDAPFNGMDPSDPATYVRPWNPAGGMIAYLNYDGAAAQARQPTGGVQRGRQQRRRG